METPILNVAIETLRKHFKNKIGQPIKTPFFQSQLEILYENDFYPWVLTDALKELEKENYLRKITEKEIPNFSKLKNIQKISFFINKKAIKDSSEELRIKKRAFNIAEYVNEYSDPQNSKMVGDHLEDVVKAELKAQEFKIVGIHTNEYNGRKWDRTEHDLDFIGELKGSRLAIGVEVKNTLNIMSPEEIDIKIDICNKLKIVPIFAVRWMKPYMECIRLQGGFSWIFKTQMYPRGNEEFTQSLFNKLSIEEKKNSRGYPLQFPVTVRTEIPEKSRNIFCEWIKQNKKNPPELDVSYRCGSQKRKS